AGNSWELLHQRRGAALWRIKGTGQVRTEPAVRVHLGVRAAAHSVGGAVQLLKKSVTPAALSDEGIVSRFVDNAVRILDAAEGAMRLGHTPSDMTILITPEGIRMVADSDWPLESLRAYHGAGMAYRVSERESMIRVEGRAGSRTCLFETAKPERAARLLL